MRSSVRRFAEEAIAVLPIEGPVVEVGGRPAEGQEEIADLRTLFDGIEYLTCDIQPGPTVDRVEDVHDLSFETGSIGAVLAFDTLEHVADPIRAMQEIHRVLRPGGVTVITSVMLFPIHAHPWDYWRFTPEGFANLLAPFDQRLVLAQGEELLPVNVFGVGIKGASPELTAGLFPQTLADSRRWTDNGEVTIGGVRMPLSRLWRLTAKETLEAARRRLPGQGS